MDEVSVSIANENVENSDVTDVVTAIADDGLIDYVTGREVKDTPKERVRQRIERALFHEYGLSVEDMEPDFPLPVEIGGKTRRKKVEIAIFTHEKEHAVEITHAFNRAGRVCLTAKEANPRNCPKHAAKQALCPRSESHRTSLHSRVFPTTKRVIPHSYGSKISSEQMLFFSTLTGVPFVGQARLGSRIIFCQTA